MGKYDLTLYVNLLPADITCELSARLFSVGLSTDGHPTVNRFGVFLCTHKVGRQSTEHHLITARPNVPITKNRKFSANQKTITGHSIFSVCRLFNLPKLDAKSDHTNHGQNVGWLMEC